MPAPTPRPALSVDRIVDGACRLIARDGLGGLSMRKLGAELGVDPMAVYHHVADKRALLRLVTARTLSDLAAPDPGAPWPDRVRQWALGYWDLVVAHRDLTLAGLADPEIAAGGLPSTEALAAAVADAGLAPEAVEPATFLVVDAVHGSALAAGSSGRQGGVDLAAARRTFEAGLDLLVGGFAGLAQRRR